MSQSTNEHDEEKLWRNFRDGDEKAFSLIYTRFFPVLYQYSYHIVREENIVKDCIQNLFVELWRSRSNLADTDSVKYYLLKAIRRKVYRAIQKESVYVEFMEGRDEKDVFFSPELELIISQTEAHHQEILKQAINQLSNRQKEAITLLYIEGLSYPQISDIMSLKVRSVYNLIHTALESLRKDLNQPGIWFLLTALLSV
ncbi:RNA polymerase sigma factor, sigma-70 family [Pseudarcicella hirudinis]|uniref:RNA polymerase sigma factor, sigma-70 family n=1 Tax=Pseudarcicella hirudinis TaxID=1079859 RepID=A0A1I5TJT1_9BACT|nr:RNA polymerase sigma factor [Pseudarcicella hirudinis]SFP83312.1 RNA polymerase sigma factor, sigma-70 family [Pseudarcicella hirudinis]